VERIVLAHAPLPHRYSKSSVELRSSSQGQRPQRWFKTQERF
jgi:hypothetical protein